MGSNREIKSDGSINITSTQTNISGDLDVTGSINNFTFPGSDGLAGQALVTSGTGTLSFADSGSGGGSGKNYIENTRATSDISGYATYADAAAETPVDGTGGSANITYTRNTTTPLRDGGDFKIAKDAVNRQGEGVGNAFTIDNADKSKKLIISFDYDASHAGYSDGDVRIYIFDVTNSSLIRVNGEDLKAGKSKHYAQFQAASNSTSYRLIFHVASTNASAYDVFLDEISVGPQNISHGTILTDWESWTPTGSWSSNTTYTGFKKRIGDMGHYVVDIATSGAPTSADLFINMPSGEVIDTTKLTNTFSQTHLGRLSVRDSSESAPDDNLDGKVFYRSTTTVTLKRLVNSSTSEGQDDVNQSSPITFGSGDRIVATWSVPIVGFSSNSKMSEDFSGRDVACKVLVDGDYTVSTDAFQTVAYDLVDFDTTGSFDTGTHTYTVPESGHYVINLNLQLKNASGHFNGRITRNGNSQVYGFMTANDDNRAGMSVSDIKHLDKGDTITAFTEAVGVTEDSSYTVRGTASLSGGVATQFSIAKIASAQTILENETVAMRVTKDDAQSIPSTSTTKVEYDDVDYDTHGTFNSSTNKYVVPTSGIYDIYAKIRYLDIDETQGMNFSIFIFVNNANRSQITDEASASNQTSRSQQIADTLQLNKGDEIHIGLYHGDPTSEDTKADAGDMVLTVKKIK